MLVYRLEHLNGYGPYRCENVSEFLNCVEFRELDILSRKLCNAHCLSTKHPVPDHSFFINDSCACESFDKLIEWFDGWLERFAKFDYHIAIYDAFEVKLCCNQVIFNKSLANLVETISIL